MGFIEELKRRNVFKVGAAYAVVAWLIAQVADLVLENIGAPDWLMKALLLLLALGLPLALIFAWAFEMTPEGIKKEKDVDRSRSIAPRTGRKLNALIMALLVLAVAYFAVDKFVLQPEGKSATAQAPAPPPAPAAIDPEPLEKSIAVLPFANRSNREEDEFFTEGIHDDLLTHLSKIGSMKVISRTSVLRYKDTQKPIPEIAAELKVSSVLEGGIQRSGDQVRINVQLIDAKTDEHLWAEIFDRQLTAENLFAIQSEISTKIAKALKATLSPEEESRLSKVPTTNMPAYNAFLRGRQLQARRTSSDLEQALAEFRRATELDPDYAMAWVGLSDTAYLLSLYGTLPSAEALEIQEQAVARALAIDDELGEAYASQAGIYEVNDQIDLAESAYERAIELSPSYASAYQWLGNLLSNMPDRLGEAADLFEEAAQLDPMSSIIQSNRADLLGQLGRYDEAESAYLRLIDMDPGFAAAYTNLAGFYSFNLGQYAEALKWSRIAHEKDPGNIRILRQQAELYLHMGDTESAEALLNQMQDIDPGHWSLGLTDAAINVSRGNYAGAIESARWLIPKTEGQPWLTVVIAGLLTLNDNYEEARSIIRRYSPGWEDPDQWPVLIRYNTLNACMVAGVFAGSGDPELSQKLMDKAISYYQLLETRLDRAYPWAPLDCWVIEGEYEKALDMLEVQVQNDHFAYWWVNFETPWWKEVRSEPRFQAAMQTISEKASTQRRFADEMDL